MKNYLLLIYEEELSEDDLVRLSDLSFGAIVERIEEDENELITSAYLQQYELSEQGVCYRILHGDIVVDTFISSVIMMENKPFYVGLFSLEIEKRCVILSKLCSDMHGTYYYLKGMGDLAEEHTNEIENNLDLEDVIDYVKAQDLEDDYYNAINIVQYELIAIFLNNELKIAI